ALHGDPRVGTAAHPGRREGRARAAPARARQAQLPGLELAGVRGRRRGERRGSLSRMSEAIPFAILGEDGSCPDAWAGLVDDARLVRALEQMVLNRVIDRRFLMLQRQGRLGFYMTSTGEEATTLGAALCLRDDDPIFLTYRELGSLLWRDVPLELI